MQLTYSPTIFNRSNMNEAKSIILTSTEKQTTEERWKEETPYVIDLIDKLDKHYPPTTVLDFGCGIGRISKELIAKYNCRVIGVDISPTMRAYSEVYVNNPNFAIVSPEMFEFLLSEGLTYDLAISVWALQHCLNPAFDLMHIQEGLYQEGSFFLLNEERRFVPTEKDWVDDSIDMLDLSDRYFDRKAKEMLDAEFVGEETSKRAYWAHYIK